MKKVNRIPKRNHQGLKVLADGKTKTLYAFSNSSRFAVAKSWDVITAKDGKLKGSFPRKGEFSTRTTSRIFELARACGIAVAYRKQLGKNEFLTLFRDMEPFEIVARRRVTPKSSWSKRNPGVKVDGPFTTLVVEFYLKTTNGKFRGMKLPSDDPIVTGYGPWGVKVRRADMSAGPDNPEIEVPAKLVFGSEGRDAMPSFKAMETIVRKVGLMCEKAWSLQFCTWLDIKIEVTVDGLLADVIDNDSHRLLGPNGEHLDKQPFRDRDTPIQEIARRYEEVADRAERFTELIEKPRIILWCASETDPYSMYEDELMKLGAEVELVRLVGSLHKAPEKCLKMFRRELERRPHCPTAVVANVGLSNGAGPTLQGDTHLNVTSVPVGWETNPAIIDSSLHLPSDLSAGTILKPRNALQQALSVLAERSPQAYMARRFLTESHHLDYWNSPTYGRND